MQKPFVRLQKLPGRKTGPWGAWGDPGLALFWLGLALIWPGLALFWPGLSIWCGLAWGCRGLAWLGYVWPGLGMAWPGLAMVWPGLGMECALPGYGVTWLGTHAGHEQSQDFALRAKF